MPERCKTCGGSGSPSDMACPYCPDRLRDALRKGGTLLIGRGGTPATLKQFLTEYGIPFRSSSHVPPNKIWIISNSLPPMDIT